MRNLLGTVAALTLLGATPALAVEFDAWDADANRYIGEDEFAAGIGETDLFETYDVDQDDALGTEEIAIARYQTMDLDGDGELTVDEWDRWVDANVGETEVNLSASDWDENGDNVISQTEFEEEVVRIGGFVDAGTDERYEERQFQTELFQDLDLDDDDRLAEDEFLIDNFGI